MITRREGIQQGMMAATMTGVPAFAAGLKKKKKIGVQIYSARNELYADFEGTLKKLSQMGYRQIEAFGLNADRKFIGRIDATYFKALCGDLGMHMVATHCNFFMPDQVQRYVDGALEAGVDFLIIPYIPDDKRKTLDDYRRLAEGMNQIGAVCKQAGLQFGYHNHAFEFETLEGAMPMEVLISETDSGLVSFELDLFWVVHAGVDPASFIKKHTGRFSCFHVKDSDERGRAVTVGQGRIDFAAAFAANQKYLKAFFVEDEREADPFGNLQGAFDYLQKASFV
jgi:sugar phosphate isomerase/epimerase